MNEAELNRAELHLWEYKSAVEREYLVNLALHESVITKKSRINQLDMKDVTPKQKENKDE